MTKKKRTLSPEHLAKLQAGRVRAQQTGIEQLPKPEFNKTILDLTKENVPNETDLIERIRRMFDEGNNPDQIKVTSRQTMDILDNSNRLNDRHAASDYITYYASPFGDHEIKIIPAKDIV